MAVSALRTIRDSVSGRRFDGAYHVFGDDDFQKDDAVRQLTDAALDGAIRDFNLDVLRGADLSGGEFLSIVNTPPMMAERRVVVVRDAGGLRRDAREALQSYLKHPAAGTLLILVAASGSKEDKVLSGAATPLQLDPLSEERVPRWIVHHASVQHGVDVAADAAELLAGVVGNDLYRLASEVDKLASYTGGGAVSVDAVEAVVGVRRGETLADFLDLVLARDATAAVGVVPHILGQPKTSAVSVVMALATQVLALAWGRARLDEGVPRGRLEGEYLGLIRQTRLYPWRSWGDAARAWARWAPEWTVEACDRAVDVLLDADIALKESRVSSEDQVLATAVLAVCASE